ncbi:uncharacterized protein QC763_205350 [Podospora pseudopauciseta]|uniref:Gylcosyl hydrolase 115 C-terminal domain-containing protein n=1 Tax=Podospora pseudopauciseta TaxID=2093780 RepID=A0ABR0HNP3_9PEZI|nr:hypothetical protein QC763_205350 [Podospora pseudopauciseta]
MAPFLELAALALALFTPAIAYTEKPSIFSFSATGTGLQLGGANLAPEIRVAPNDLPGVRRVANDLALDFGRVLGVNGTVVVADWSSTISQKWTKPIILVGTVGQSSLIDNLGSTKKFDTVSIANKWETFAYQVVQSPWEGSSSVFVIAGSDLRGTAYGVYDVSEKIGVSPWHYWADVPAKKKQYIWANSDAYTEGPPSVRYRGIFLNDESPGLTGWGRTKFTPSQYGSPFVLDFYKLIFELILRMKGNYLWPAMWSSMFYLDDTRNGPTATEYGIFVGTSHHEPMARADKEQGRFLRGSWDWRSNKAGVQAFMQEGPTRAKNWSTIYTVGMRGSGDAASPSLNSQALEEVIAWQQQTLTKTIGKPLSEIPHAWMMYKEVPGYWQKGMKVSDDVTIVWSDDNRGNIRRVPIGNEGNRVGGTGMYYHFDYVGDPRNYKWINTIQLQKTWEQMTLAYDSGVDKLWIANVGDLKGLELPTAHFMAMAWDRKAFTDLDSTKKWLGVWGARQWGELAGDTTASIMTRYGKLTARMKYEDLSRTPFAFDTISYDEAELNFNEWTSLLKNAQAVHDALTSDVKTSFWEVVLHPIVAGRGVYEIYTKVALAGTYRGQHRVSANKLLRDVQAAFSADQAITRQYHSILSGKWNNVMAQTHIGYNNWQEPASNSLPGLTWLTTQAKNALMGVAVQGSSGAFPGSASLTLPAASPYMAPSDQRWLDVFARDNGTFSYRITSNASFVSVTNAQNTISTTSGTTDIRSLISVDWSKAPVGNTAASLSIANLNATGTTATVILPIQNNNVPDDFKGHVEANNVVSIEAEHFAPPPASSSAYLVIPDYGRTLSGVKLPPKTPSQQAGKGHVLSYPFYTFSTATAATLTVYLAPSENANPNSPNKYTFGIDGGSQTTVQTVGMTDGSTQPQGWSDAVVKGSYVKTNNIGRLNPGKHELKVWLLEPTMVITKVVIDVGGLKSSLMGPPESAQV